MIKMAYFYEAPMGILLCAYVPLENCDWVEGEAVAMRENLNMQASYYTTFQERKKHDR